MTILKSMFIIRYTVSVHLFCSGHDYAAKELQDLCQCTLNDFNLCMFYQATSWSDLSESNAPNGSTSYSDEERPLYLDDDLIFKIAVMSMMCIHFQRQMSE